ncbi:MAG: hypothetical protein APR54_00405 [Candidatus Cloacimonas sp. SDB]|nr:MAG: hypothetical protein APR54_00405 [Candidatus Cloacimonas sp. SDB]
MLNKVSQIFTAVIILISCQIFAEFNYNEVYDQFKSGKAETRREILQNINQQLVDVDFDHSIEFLRNLIELSELPENTAQIYNLIGDRYYNSNNYQEAIVNYNLAIEQIKSLSPHIEEAYAFFSLGDIFADKLQYNKALEYYESAEAVYFKLGEISRRADVFNNIGLLYDSLIVYDEALVHYFKALLFYESIEDKEGIANSYINIGNIYLAMSNHKQSLEYYNKAHLIYIEMKDEQGISDCLNNIGIIYSDLNENHKALSYYMESLEYAQKLEDEAGIATNLNNIGITYKKLGNFDKALQSYQQSIDLSNKLEDKWGVANTLSNMGELYIDYGDYLHGLDYLNKGLEIARDYNFQDLLMEGYKIFAKYYVNMEDYKKAFQNYQYYVSLKDSLVLDSSKRITEIQSIYEKQKHNKEIELLKLKQQHGYNTRLLLYIASAIFLAIIIWLYIINKNKKKEIKKRIKLEKNVNRLAHIVNQAEASIIMTDLEGKILYVNKFLEKITGYTREEVLGKNPRIFKSGLIEQDVYQNLWDTINTGQVWKGIFLNKKKNGDLFFEDVIIFPIKDESGNLINFASVKKDITEQIRAQNELSASEFRFRTMAKKINDGLMIVENEKVVYVNDKFVQLTGYQLEEIQKLEKSDLIALSDKQNILELIEEIENEPEENRNIELWFKRKDGRECCVLCGLTHHKTDNDNSAFYLVLSDITERKISEEKLLKSLKEKEILIKEIHHRVKNNMQVVSSLLQLQSRYIKDQETLEIFRKSQNRVRSMSMIHEKLYKSGDFTKIDFNDYIRKLAHHLLVFYSIDINKIQIVYQISDIYLDITQAIPLGLIINELLSNCLKYAFVGKERGLITVSLNQRSSNYILIIEDNGIGMPKDYNKTASKPLGLQLVNSLSEQLHGKLDITINNGTCLKLTFPAATAKDL